MAKNKTKPKVVKSKKTHINNRHDHGHGEPFSMARNVPKIEMEDTAPRQNNKKPAQFAAFDNFLRSGMIGDVKKTINSCVNSSSCTISNSADATNAATNLMENVLNKFSNSMSESVQQNMVLNQDLLKCKDLQDVLNFQRKMFEKNFSNMVNLCLDVGYSMQSFASKNLEISAECIDRNIKCFTEN